MLIRIATFLLLSGLVLAQEPQPARVATGFRFTEGPAADAQGNVYFTDVRSARIHRLDAAGEVTTFREESGRANGLMFNGMGELVACEGGSGRVVAMTPDGKSIRVLADAYKGKRFNAPNDLVIDKAGGVYFTDPEFGREVKKPQGTFAVYYIAASGDVTRVVESLPHPNGIILAPDESTLYVVPSRSADVMAYPVTAPGALGKGRVFFSLLQPEGRKGTGGDGLTVDTLGNLYITSWLGIQVVSPQGKHVRTLTFPEKPSNVTFGGKSRKTLYVTARTSVYALSMQATGHVFATGRPKKPKPVTLSSFVGTFRVEGKLQVGGGAVVTTSATAVFKPVLGGRFVRQDYDDPNTPVKGIGYLGYEPRTKRFSSVWMYSMSARMERSEGTVDANGVLRLNGPGRAYEHRWLDADTRVMKSWSVASGGKRALLYEFTYRRVKSAGHQPDDNGKRHKED